MIATLHTRESSGSIPSPFLVQMPPMRTCHSLWCQENRDISVGLAPIRVKIRASACSFKQQKRSTKILPAYSCTGFSFPTGIPATRNIHRAVNKLKTRDMETCAANGNGCSGHRELCVKALNPFSLHPHSVMQRKGR